MGMVKKYKNDVRFIYLFLVCYLTSVEYDLRTGLSLYISKLMSCYLINDCNSWDLDIVLVHIAIKYPLIDQP